MKSILKRFWALFVIGALLISGIGYFTYQKFDGLVKGKKVDGKDVVVSINGYDVLADDLYYQLMQTADTDEIAYIYFENLVVKEACKITDDIKKEAKISVDSTVQQFKEQYGDDYKIYLEAAMKQEGIRGLDELDDYFTHYLCLNEIQMEYFEENRKTLFEPYYKENDPRVVSHILVKMEDPDKPTEEESKKLDEVKAEIKKGTELKEIAKKYSDDGSASNGGELGMVDKNENYVESFKKSMMKLKKGEAEWVKSEYGWHYIWVNETEMEELLKRPEIDQFIASKLPGIGFDIIDGLAKDVNITFGDAAFEAKVKRYIEASKGGQ